MLHAPLFYDLLPPCRVISLWPCPHRHYFRKLRNQNPACRWERGGGRTTCALLIQSYTQEIHCGSTSAILTHKNSCCCCYCCIYPLSLSPPLFSCTMQSIEINDNLRVLLEPLRRNGIQ